jgi:glucokinase
MKKVVIDIGGTKTLISIMENGRIKSIENFSTPKNRKELLKILSKSFEYSGSIENLNVALAGRYKDNKVILSPNIPLQNFNLGRFLSEFKNVRIDNDTVCAAYNLIKKNVRNALLINWGTGIGGAIIIDGKVYKGEGRAGEVGHLRLLDGDWEDRIGGKAFEKRFNVDGVNLQRMALEGNKSAIEKLNLIGIEFGEFIVSMVYLLDPEKIYIYGGVINSWAFMKKGVKKKLEEYSMKKRIYVIRDRYFTLRGCYYLDEF